MAARNTDDRRGRAARRPPLTRAAAATEATRLPPGERAGVGAGRLALAFALLLALAAPLALRAQSGRRQPGATPTPTPQRPRRAPTHDPQPGQPATPDAPSTTTATPDPSKASGQPGAAADPAIEDDEVYRVESNLVPVSANVSDAAGHAVVDLKAEDFELRVDGQPKPISDISFSETPVRLALLFDNSSSIRPTRELEKHAAAGFFRKVLRPVDQAAVFSIATYPTLDQQLTNDAARLARTIEAYGDVENSTALFDTIVMAAEYLRPMPGRKVIVIVSDGVETTSRLTDFGEVVRRVLAADCQVFVIQTGLSDNANLRDLMAERRMLDLSASTGGAVFTPKLPADLEGAFTQISNDLKQQYILSYYPSDDGRDGRFRAISLRVKTRPNMRVRARRGYYPRRRPDNLSTLQQNFVETNAAAGDQASQPPNQAASASQAASSPSDPAAHSSPSPASPQADSRQPAPGEVASNARAAAPPRASGPVHGSKNMDIEESGGVGRAEAANAANAAPAVRLGNFRPQPAETPSAAPSATPANPDPAPAPADARDAAGTDPATRPAGNPNQTPAETANALRATRARTAAAPRDEQAQQQQAAEQPGAQSRPAEPESAGARPPESESAKPRASESAQPGSSEPAQPSSSESQAAPAGQAKPDAPARKAPVSGGVLNARAISLPRPVYPDPARRMRIAGTVSVEVLIDEKGRVVSARAVSGPGVLRDAAASAARQARFSPTLVSGLPVQVAGVINYNFSL